MMAKPECSITAGKDAQMASSRLEIHRSSIPAFLPGEASIAANWKDYRQPDLDGIGLLKMYCVSSGHVKR